MCTALLSLWIRRDYVYRRFGSFLSRMDKTQIVSLRIDSIPLWDMLRTRGLMLGQWAMGRRMGNGLEWVNRSIGHRVSWWWHWYCGYCSLSLSLSLSSCHVKCPVISRSRPRVTWLTARTYTHAQWLRALPLWGLSLVVFFVWDISVIRTRAAL